MNLNITLSNEELQAAKSQSFDLLPKGNYVAQIEDSDIRTTKSGGEMLGLKWRILDGQHTNRIVFQNINLKNSNPVAVQIGRKALGQIFSAIGIQGVRDSSELHNIPLEIRVVIKADKTGQYEDSNEITAVMPLAQQQQSYQQHAAPQAQPMPSSAPWAR